MKVNKHTTDQEIIDFFDNHETGEFIMCQDDESFDRVNKVLGLRILECIKKTWCPECKKKAGEQ